MELILGIETGTDICSVSLSRDGELIALRESSDGQDHARRLAVYIDEILRENGLKPADLDAIAVGKGPGSYTGLRIGVSTAKGLCYALGIPFIAVGSLESLAWVAVDKHRAGRLGGVGSGSVDTGCDAIGGVRDWDSALLCPMIDARRMEVYAQVFDSSLHALGEVEAHVVTPGSFAEFIGSGNFDDGSLASARPDCSADPPYSTRSDLITHSVSSVRSAHPDFPAREFVIFGNGAAKCVDILPRDGLRYVDVAPSARGLVRPAYEAFIAGRFEDIAYFEPLYLKDFVVTTAKKKVL